MFCYLTHSWAELSSQFGVLGGAEELLCTSGEMRMLSRSKGETTSALEITPLVHPRHCLALPLHITWKHSGEMELPDIFPQLTSFTVPFGPARTNLLRKHPQSGQETRWSPLTRVSSARQAAHYSSARLGGEQPGHRLYLSCPCLFLRLSIHSYSPQYPSCPLGELSPLPTHPKLHHLP